MESGCHGRSRSWILSQFDLFVFEVVDSGGKGTVWVHYYGIPLQRWAAMVFLADWEEAGEGVGATIRNVGGG